MDNWAVVDWTKDVWHFVVGCSLQLSAGLQSGLKENQEVKKQAYARTQSYVLPRVCL